MRLAVELDDLRLVHVAEPQVAVAIAAQAEQTGGEAGLSKRDGELGHFSAARIEAPEILLTEARVPRGALRIDDHVVRLDELARQVVLRIDDTRRAALWARVGL